MATLPAFVAVEAIQIKRRNPSRPTRNQTLKMSVRGTVATNGNIVLTIPMGKDSVHVEVVSDLATLAVVEAVEVVAAVAALVAVLVAVVVPKEEVAATAVGNRHKTNHFSTKIRSAECHL